MVLGIGSVEFFYPTIGIGRFCISNRVIYAKYILYPFIIYLSPLYSPCIPSYEWSILFLLIMIVAVTAMLFHMFTLWKRRAALSAYDILFVAFFFAASVQFGPMLSQVRKYIVTCTQETPATFRVTSVICDEDHFSIVNLVV